MSTASCVPTRGCGKSACSRSRSYSTLGVRKVFFHTFDGGKIMKRLCGGCEPPRSLYTHLPEQFCFTKTQSAPKMFASDPRLAYHTVEWFSLELV